MYTNYIQHCFKHANKFSTLTSVNVSVNILKLSLSVSQIKIKGQLKVVLGHWRKIICIGATRQIRFCGRMYNQQKKQSHVIKQHAYFCIPILKLVCRQFIYQTCTWMVDVLLKAKQYYRDLVHSRTKLMRQKS